MHSSDGRHRIESYARENDPRGQGQRVVETATGAIVFDTQPLEACALLEFNEADLRVPPCDF